MSIDKTLLDLVEKRYGENEKTGEKNKQIELREKNNITPFDQTKGNNVEINMGGGGRLNRQNTSTSKLMKLLNKK